MPLYDFKSDIENRLQHRPYVINLLFIFLICCTKTVVTSGEEAITIMNHGTSNALLLYKNRPMFKTGPISEDRIFMYSIGSSFFDHQEWFDYMQEYSFEFGRVYPAHTWHQDQVVLSRKPLYPFQIKCRTKQGYPIVDLSTTDRQYWSNFSQVLEEAEKRNIVICIQLSTRDGTGATAQLASGCFFTGIITSTTSMKLILALSGSIHQIRIPMENCGEFTRPS